MKTKMEMSKQGREWMQQWQAINAGTAPANWRENPPPSLAEITRHELDRVRRGIPPDESDLASPRRATTATPIADEIPLERVVKRFGALARSHRITRRMRQCDLARFAGVHESVIGRIENGAQAPRLDDIVRLARALDVKPWQIVRAAIDAPAGENEWEVVAG